MFYEKYLFIYDVFYHHLVSQLQIMAAHVSSGQLRPVRRSEHRGPRSVVAGGLTGAVNILLIFPTEFIKTQLQLDGGRTVLSAHHSRLGPGTLTPIATVLSSCKQKVYAGSLDVIKKTVRERGVVGLYRGVQVLLAGTIPTYAVRLMAIYSCFVVGYSGYFGTVIFQSFNLRLLGENKLSLFMFGENI